MAEKWLLITILDLDEVVHFYLSLLCVDGETDRNNETIHYNLNYNMSPVTKFGVKIQVVI